jgi:hypothetical protein
MANSGPAEREIFHSVCVLSAMQCNKVAAGRIRPAMAACLVDVEARKGALSIGRNMADRKRSLVHFLFLGKMRLIGQGFNALGIGLRR